MIQLDKGSPEPLPVQIKRAIADRIRSGLLHQGERLPAVRQLAEQLGVSPVTVMQAYAALEAAGLVDRQHGRGVFVRVRHGGAAPTGESAPDPGGQAWQQGVIDYIPRALGWALRLRDYNTDLLQMQTAIVSADLLPVGDLVHDLRTAVLNDPLLLGRYSPVAGVPRLRAAAAAYLRSTGVPVSSDDLMITQGAQQGIDLIARTFVGPGDAIAMESPAYPPAIDAFRARGARIYPIPVDGEGMRTDLLAEIPGLKLVYTVPAYQNPTGAVLSRRRIGDLMELARERRLLIVEDDPWREIQFGKAPPSPLKSQDEGGHVIYLKSFGKLVSVGVRVGALAASGRVYERLLAAKGVVDQGTALLPQVALQSLLDSPRMARHLRKLTAQLLVRRDAMLHALEAHAPRGVRWTSPEGGLSVWVTAPAGVNTEALLPQAMERGVIFAPGAPFFVGEPEANHLRLSYGMGNPEQIARGVAALCALLKQ